MKYMALCNQTVKDRSAALPLRFSIRCRNVSIDSLQYFIRRQPGDHFSGTIQPAHRAATIQEDRRWRVGIATVWSRVCVDESYRLGQAASGIREYQQVGKVGLRLLGVVESFHRNHDHARVASSELFVPSFELT